jgi:hypothetical protein
MGKYYVKLNRNLICSKCGVKSQRYGKCWEKGVCANCFDSRYLSCKICGATSNNVKAHCWKDNLCGLCWKRENKPKKYEPQYKLCKNCNERLVALFYTRNGIHVNTGNYICPKCSEIFIFSTKYRVNNG